MPPLIADAAKGSGWSEDQTISGWRGTWTTLRNGELTIDVWRDRWRHTTARVYRGNALTAILRTQREVAAYLTT